MAFAYYKKVTIDHTQCGSADSTDFPITIWVTDADLKTVGNGGFVQNANGYDIRPYSDLALTTPLTFELVLYTGTTGVVEMHVKIPTVSHSTDTVFYLGFGDSGITTDGSSTSTWSNSFEVVYHFKDGTTLSLSDSSPGGRNLTGTNTPTAAAGNIDGGIGLASASSQYARSSAFQIAGGPSRVASITVWAKATSFPSSYIAVGGKNDGTFFFELLVRSTGKLACYLVPSAGGTVNYDGSGSHTLSTGTWNHLAMTYGLTNGLIGYVNASQDGTAAANGFLQDTSNGNWIGNDAFPPRYWNGVIDEYRLASVERSPSWITTEYNNQVSGSTFLTWGARTPTGAGNSGNFLFMF